MQLSSRRRSAWGYCLDAAGQQRTAGDALVSPRRRWLPQDENRHSAGLADDGDWRMGRAGRQMATIAQAMYGGSLLSYPAGQYDGNNFVCY